MCASCGCGDVRDNHGNPANITLDDIQRAAEAARLEPEDVAANIASSSVGA